MSPFLRLLAHLCRLPRSHEASSPRSAQNHGSEVHSCLAQALVQLESLTQEVDPPPTSFLPIGCELLGQVDLTVVGSRPVDAGGFADVWIGRKNDGTVVAIKSPRCHSSSSCLPVYSRLYQEALMYSHLNDNDISFVPFVGVCSTREHPFALVFRFMDHMNLRGYLRDNQDIGRLQLLLGIARGLKHMHGLGMVHGNLNITNVLVGGDGHARISGLGMAFILPVVPAVNGDRSFRVAASELIGVRRGGLEDTGATMAGDVYAFAVLAWEVFAGRPPFSDENVIAGAHSMSNGRRPARPDHRDLSDPVWKMIEDCWKSNPAQRKTATEVVTILEAENNQ